MSSMPAFVKLTEDLEIQLDFLKKKESYIGDEIEKKIDYFNDISAVLQ